MIEYIVVTGDNQKLDLWMLIVEGMYEMSKIGNFDIEFDYEKAYTLEFSN